ncbi:hypothetical protein RhiJN_25386 [Ceratobasidium sp. AG-Ba]|nr:hypothetical protein RhiJN_25386 [Ceratobasidium sp. AG-Ba]
MDPSADSFTTPLSPSHSETLTRASGYIMESRNSGDEYQSANTTAIDLDRCIVTRAIYNVKDYPVLDPMDHIEYAPQLEYALGIPEGTLGKDAARNTITVQTDIYDHFKRGDWILMPDRTTLRELLVWTLHDHGKTKREIYNKFFFEETYEYTFVNLLDNAQGDRKANQLSLLNDCPPIRLRVHPCYALCDAVPKIDGHCYTSTDENLKERISMATTLVDQWLTAAPYAFDLPPPSPRVLSRSLSELSSFHGSDICSHEPVIDPNEPGPSKCCCLGFPCVYPKSSGKETVSPSGSGSHIDGCQKKVKFAESVDEDSHYPKDSGLILTKWMVLAFAVSVFLNLYLLKTISSGSVRFGSKHGEAGVENFANAI